MLETGFWILDTTLLILVALNFILDFSCPPPSGESEGASLF